MKRMIKYSYAGILLLGMWACTQPVRNQAPHILALNKLTREGPVNINDQARPGLYQYALIENTPNNPDSLRQLLRTWCDSAVNKPAMEKQYYRYFIQFFNRSAATESYLQGKEDFWDTHNDINQELSDYRGELRYERCSQDSLQGQWTLEVSLPGYHQVDTLGHKCTE